MNRVKTKRAARNLFEVLVRDGSDKAFVPAPAHEPTAAMPGSRAKLAVLAKRIASGEELWHERDRDPRAEPD